MKKHRIALALTLSFPFTFPTWAAGADPVADVPEAASPALGVVTVTSTREKSLLAQTPASVGVVDAATIRSTGPMHPQQILGQVPGVGVAVTNGEGHTTAIRQPFNTAPMYLYLEDGIPTRATGFFNSEELSVALELVNERLAEGEGSHYRFLVAEDGGHVLVVAGERDGPSLDLQADGLFVERDESSRQLQRLFFRGEQRRCENDANE